MNINIHMHRLQLLARITQSAINVTRKHCNKVLKSLLWKSTDVDQ